MVRASTGRKRAPGSPPADWPFVSIVVASLNGGDFLLRNLAALLALEYPTDRREIVLVDDASDDGSVDRASERYAEAIESGTLRIVRNEQSSGVAGAYNRGVRAARPEARFILKSDNDVLPQPSALAALVRQALANPHAGILGGRIYFLGEPDRIQFVGGNLRSAMRGPALMHTPPEVLACGADSEPVYLDVINSCFALIRRQVFEWAGLFPEYYGRYEYEDYEFAFRARRLGYGSLYCPDAVGHHAVSMSSSDRELSELRVRQRARNGVLFMSRFAPRGWLVAFLVYHLAKLPFDSVRGGQNPWLRLAGYIDGLRAARAGSVSVETLPAPGA